MRIVSIQEMRDLENTIYEKYGMNETLIIENVGSRGADYLYQTYFKKTVLLYYQSAESRSFYLTASFRLLPFRIYYK